MKMEPINTEIEYVLKLSQSEIVIVLFALSELQDTALSQTIRLRAADAHAKIDATKATPKES